jgi:hypothetical protein
LGVIEETISYHYQPYIKSGCDSGQIIPSLDSGCRELVEYAGGEIGLCRHSYNNTIMGLNQVPFFKLIK